MEHHTGSTTFLMEAFAAAGEIRRKTRALNVAQAMRYQPGADVLFFQAAASLDDFNKNENLSPIFVVGKLINKSAYHGSVDAQMILAEEPDTVRIATHHSSKSTYVMRDKTAVEFAGTNPINLFHVVYEKTNIAPFAAVA